MRHCLYSPMVSYRFHADSGKYVVSIRRGSGKQPQYGYMVAFKDDALVKFEGDAMPSEAQFIAQLDVRRKLGKVPPLEATEEQLKAAQIPAAVPAAGGAVPNANVPATPLPPAKSYPPLEGGRQ